MSDIPASHHPQAAAAALAVCNRHGQSCSAACDMCRTEYSRMITAFEAAGLHLVPTKPTAAMKERVAENGGAQAVAWALAAWPDMLAGAKEAADGAP
jgi:hypothetical protein